MLSDYLECAFWSSTDDNGEPLTKYSLADLGDGQLEKAERDLQRFYEAAEPYIEDGVCVGQVAHDYWLTRNGHGAGFYDRPEIYDGELKENFFSQWYQWYREKNQKLNSQKLTEIAQSFGMCDLYVGDDNKLYFFP